MDRVPIILLVGIAAAGCAGDSYRARMRRPPKPVANVDRIEMFSSMAAINFDHRPGADGVSVRVLLYQLSQPYPVTVSGTLEFMLYEGKIGPEELHTRQPLHLWRFPPERLPPQLSRSMVGWGYAMDLLWGPGAPKTGTISLATKYVPPEGSAVYSDPIAVAMGAR